jgi:GNAT superfamily N-acetyltransferase
VSEILIRRASEADLEAIVSLHAADELGGHGDVWTPETEPAYREALRRISDSPDNELYVTVSDAEVIGSFQLTFVPAITNRGTLRCVLEAVQVRSDQRSRGVGAMMVAFAEGRARARGAGIVQLTSNKRRLDAHRFYERLGYERSHEGFKKVL